MRRGNILTTGLEHLKTHIPKLLLRPGQNSRIAASGFKEFHVEFMLVNPLTADVQSIDEDTRIRHRPLSGVHQGEGISVS